MQEITFIFIKEATGGRIIRVAIRDIEYLESMGNYVRIVYDTDKFLLVHSSLRKLLASLPAAKFCRIHQSHVIHIEHIHHVDGNTVNMQNGVKMKIGTNFRKAFLEKLLVQG